VHAATVTQRGAGAAVSSRSVAKRANGRRAGTHHGSVRPSQTGLATAVDGEIFLADSTEVDQFRRHGKSSTRLPLSRGNGCWVRAAFARFPRLLLRWWRRSRCVSRYHNAIQEQRAQKTGRGTAQGRCRWSRRRGAISARDGCAEESRHQLCSASRPGEQLTRPPWKTPIRDGAFLYKRTRNKTPCHGEQAQQEK